jgi:hemerythrin
MAYMEWTQDLSTGMADIDEQHKRWITLINKAKDASERKLPREAQGEVLRELLEYVRYHFETEEKYFAKFNYPSSNEHKEQHAHWLKKTLEFADRFDAGDDFGQELFLFLKEWLMTHIKVHDMQYSKHFKKMGYI